MAGETELSRQLKKLAVPQTSLFVQQKIRKSFLFDHRDASKLDRDTIFAYGTTGIEKLRLIEPLFDKFSNTLFSLKYKDFERSVQIESVNTKLDQEIHEFLTMVSPYFMVRASHEALEWLVYRFHIHLFNVDALIGSALPYYDTTIFVRVVQLLEFTEKNRKWMWLQSVQTSGEPLPLSVILKLFNSDVVFRNLICQLAPNVLKVYGLENSNATIPVIAFSMLTVYYALDYCSEITDKQIAALLPFILKGLKSNFNQYIACSYLVISKIITKTKLSVELIEELLLRIFENLNTDLMREALELLLLFFRHQYIKKMPKKLFDVLMSSDDIFDYFEYIAENYDCSLLLQAMIKKMIPSVMMQEVKNTPDSEKRSLKFCIWMFGNVKLNEENALQCFKVTLKKYHELFKEYKADKVTKRRLKKISKLLLKNLELSYPDYFDSALKSLLDQQEFNNKLTYNLINNAVTSMKHSLVSDAKLPLLIGICHANDLIRKISVKCLMENLNSKDFDDADFIQDVLLERLNDENVEVVKEILNAPQILMDNVDKRKLLVRIQVILNNTLKDSKWSTVHTQCLYILSGFYMEDDDLDFDVFVAIFTFLFPLQERSVEHFRNMKNSGTKNNSFVDAMLSTNIEFSGGRNLLQINCEVLQLLKAHLESLDIATKQHLLSLIVSKENFKQSEALIIVFEILIESSMAATNDDHKTNELLQTFLAFSKHVLSHHALQIDNFHENMEKRVIHEKCIQALTKRKISVSFLCDALFGIIQKIKVEENLMKINHWIADDSVNIKLKSMTSWLEFCIEHANSNTELAEVFKYIISLFMCQFTSLQDVYWFMSHIWLNGEENYSLMLQVASLNITKAISDECQDYEWFYNKDSAVIPSLLVLVASSIYELRYAALSLIKTVLISGSYDNALKALMSEICKHFEEIISDSQQAYAVVNHWLHVIDKDELKTGPHNEKFSVFNYFLHLMKEEMTPHVIKHCILSMLKDASSLQVLTDCIPILNHYLNLYGKDQLLKKIYLDIIQLILQKFTTETAVALEENSAELEVLLKCLQFIHERNEVSDFSVQTMGLNVITKPFFSSIPSFAVKQKILEMVINLYLTSNNPEQSQVISKVLRKLCTYSHLLLNNLLEDELTAAKNATTLREIKKSQSNDSDIELDDLDKFESGPWKKVIVILEIIQNKTKIDKREMLVPVLFGLLNKILDFESQSAVEYTRQLILSSIYNCCEHLGVSGLDERHFQVGLIVQCIRISDNPQTHHQCLLLLNLAAGMYPEYVLSNVMSIFTFMGSSLVRQDDNYSFQVIYQTIETIVPSLLKASSQEANNNTMQVVGAVTRVFVNSLCDIPQHRQLPLFTKLITTLDPSTYLWIPLCQICDQYSGTFQDVTIHEWEACLHLEFAVHLHIQFPLDVQIDSAISVLKFLAILPDSKENFELDPDMKSLFEEMFNIESHSNDQLQLYKHNLLLYTNIWLSSKELLDQLCDLDEKFQNSLESKYESFLEVTLNYLHHHLSLNDETPSHKNITVQLYELINHINSVLPCKLFIRITKQLIQNPLDAIKQRALELLNAKLEHQQAFFTIDDHHSLLKLTRPLLKVVKHKDTELILNQQTALFSLHLLIKMLGKEYPEKFQKILTVITKILNEKDSEELIVNGLLCLAQIGICLNVRVLPYLNSFMNEILQLLEKTMNSSDSLLLAITTALMSLIENLGAFLKQNHVQVLVTHICLLLAHYAEVKGKKSIEQNLSSLQTLLAKEIQSRVLIPAIENSYEELIQKNKSSIKFLVHILEAKVSNFDVSDVKAYSSMLQKFYIVLLDFRYVNYELEYVTEVEGDIISSLKAFVYKLSETHFGIFFQKIYQWATTTELPHKVFTFYRLTFELCDSLKSLFVTNLKYFIRHAACVLDQTNSSKSGTPYFEHNPSLNIPLLNYILDSLKLCFEFQEAHHILDKQSFEILMQPVVDQLENVDDEMAYQTRVDNHLAGCIAHLMAGVSDNALWKSLNYQILLKTRHSSAHVRFASIQVLSEVVKKMGDNYLMLLPESIPFLAEMMEDDSTEVAEGCQSLIIEMEKILGEPIRKYF